MEIKTNHHARPLVTFSEACDAKGFDTSDFDYIEEHQHCDPRLFCYRGHWYDVNEFVRIIPQGSTQAIGFCHYDHSGKLNAWDGIQTDSYFSAVVVRIARDEFGYMYEDYIVPGTVLS